MEVMLLLLTLLWFLIKHARSSFFLFLTFPNTISFKTVLYMFSVSCWHEYASTIGNFRGMARIKGEGGEGGGVGKGYYQN